MKHRSRPKTDWRTYAANLEAQMTDHVPVKAVPLAIITGICKRDVGHALRRYSATVHVIEGSLNGVYGPWFVKGGFKTVTPPAEAA